MLREHTSVRCSLCRPTQPVSSTWLVLSCWELCTEGVCCQICSALCPFDKPSLFKARLQHHLQEASPPPSAPLPGDPLVTGSQGALAYNALLPTSASPPITPLCGFKMWLKHYYSLLPHTCLPLSAFQALVPPLPCLPDTPHPTGGI